MEHELIHSPSSAPLPRYSWRELAKFPRQDALARVPSALARRLEVLPMALLDGDPPSLTLLTNRILELEEARELRFATDAEIILEEIICPELSLAIESAYQFSPPLLPRSSPQQCLPPLPDSEEPIPRLLRFLLEKAFSLNASDIHLEPMHEKLSVRFRIDGHLTDWELPEAEAKLGEALARRVKVLAKIDLTKVFLPCEGAFPFRFATQLIDVRVSTLPTVHGEKLVLRLHTFGEERPLSELGLSDAMLQQFQHALAHQSGSIILSGPTGSGKTTLLYGALETLKGSGRNIITLEDPVERKLRGISQTSIDHARGLDYATLLRFVLRQDPDIIMLGEIRDRDTAHTALTAALTGHLVLSTVHATNVFDILTRLRQFVADDDLIAKALTLLVSQRLLPQNCPHCARTTSLNHQLSRFFGLAPFAEVTVTDGCPRCSFRGANGRVAVYEFLSPSPALRRLVRERAPEELLLEEATRCGYLPYRYHLRERMVAGEISPQVALTALRAQT